MTETSPSMKRLINFEHQCTIARQGIKRLGVRPEPPSNIARKIYEYDPELIIWFNRIWQRWMLFRRGHIVMTVQNEDKSYRPLDHRVLFSLRKADTQRRGMRVLKEIEEKNDKVADDREKDFSTFVEDSSEEMRRHFRDFVDEQNDHGSINVPKEDMRVPEKEELIRQREARGGGNIKSKKVAAVPPIIGAN